MVCCMSRTMLAGALVVWVSLLMAACSTSVKVTGDVPTLLVPALSRHVTYVEPTDLVAYVHEEKLPRGGEWSIALGQMNQVFFRQLMASMFTTVTRIETVEPGVLPADEGEDHDGMIRIDLVEYGFLTPELSGLNFYSASAKYRVELADATSQSLGVWEVVGYGKAEAGAFQAGEAVNAATVMAIRDAGARIALELPDQPFFSAWLEATN
jgi:predicted small secreted protein